MLVRIKTRGGLASEWAAANTVLSSREMGMESDTGFFKWGDGVTAWNALPYANKPTDEAVSDLLNDTDSDTYAAAVNLVGGGSGDLAAAVDYANLDQALVANAYNALTPLIAVPPSIRPIVVSWGASATVLTGGGGFIGVGIGDSGTVGAILETGMAGEGKTYVAGTFSSILTFSGEKPFPPSTSWRYFRLIAGLFQDSGSSLNAKINASGTGIPGIAAPNNRPPYLRASVR